MSAPSSCRRAPTGSNAAATAPIAILDYKTGQPPTGKQVRMGLSPQLTLEAAILREGGFDGIPAGVSVSELAYVRLQRQQSAGRAKTAGAEDQARAISRSRPMSPPTTRDGSSKR